MKKMQCILRVIYQNQNTIIMLIRCGKYTYMSHGHYSSYNWRWCANHVWHRRHSRNTHGWLTRIRHGCDKIMLQYSVWQIFCKNMSAGIFPGTSYINVSYKSVVKNGDFIDRTSKSLLVHHSCVGVTVKCTLVDSYRIDRMELRNTPVHFTVNVAVAQIEVRIVQPWRAFSWTIINPDVAKMQRFAENDTSIPTFSLTNYLVQILENILKYVSKMTCL